MDLVREQRATLAAERRRYGLFARALFGVMNLVYGRQASLGKFEVLEVVARVPYQAWENVAYVGITHTYGGDKSRRIVDVVDEVRAQQDNEQWHLFILRELNDRRGTRLGWLRRRAVPQLLALLYYHLSWLLYVVCPRMSYELNADFEDHAEHEYMEYVAAHPALEREPFDSAYEADYGSFDSLADALRRIALDEREHKLESEARIAHPRLA